MTSSQILPASVGRLVCLAITLFSIGGCGSTHVDQSTQSAKKEQTSETPRPDETVASDSPSDRSHGAAEARQTTTADTDSAPAEPSGGFVATGSQPAPEPMAVELGDARLTAGIPGEGRLTTEQIDTWLSEPANHVQLDVTLPISLAGAKDMIQGLDENPMMMAKIELGRQLYFDPRLSSDGTISCASCHAPEFGYGTDTQFGIGVDGQEGGRNSPVAYNRIISGPQFWDGRADSLEDQAIGPMANPIEMGNTHDVVVKTVKQLDGYVRQFEKVFPNEGVNIDTIGKAVATFERALVTGPAPYDYLEIMKAVASQYDAEEIEEDLEDEDPELFVKYAAAKKAVDEKMSESARRGAELFCTDKSNCTACHTGANFTDEKYHNLGVGMEADEPDLGRFVVTQAEADKGAFKTPTLRNVSMTAPYMHDGSQKTLEEVVAWYAKGGHPNPYLSDKVKKLDLTEQEQADLVAFMKEGLTGVLPPVNEGRLPGFADAST